MDRALRPAHRGTQVHLRAAAGHPFFHEGKFLGPFVYGLKMERDLDTLQRVYTEDATKPQPLRFFCSGDTTSSGA